VLGPSYSHVLFITVTTLLWQPLFLTSPYGEPLSSPQQS
jgi:hypothetical protein